MRFPISVTNEMPVRVSRFRLDPDKADQFNKGYKNPAGKRVKFVRNNYKYMYTLTIDKGPGKTFIQLATPDFKQLLYSIRVLWNAKAGDPYDRHGHPVVLQAYDIDEVDMSVGAKPEQQRKKVVKDFQKAYSKNKSKA
jgi:hypothetical protein